MWNDSAVLLKKKKKEWRKIDVLIYGYDKEILKEQ